MPTIKRYKRQCGKGVIYKLLDWVALHKDNLFWYEICKQSYAIDILQDYEDYIDIAGLAANKDVRAFDMILRYEHKIEWNTEVKLQLFLQNISDMNDPKAMQWLLNKYKEGVLKTNHIMLANNNNRLIILENLFANYHAISLLTHILPKLYNEITDEEIHNIDIEILMIENHNPRVFEMLKTLLSNRKVNKRKQHIWKHISLCPSAVDYLRSHPKKINWHDLCDNDSKEAIQFIHESIMNKKVTWKKLDIDNLCSNKYAFELIKKYIDEYGWKDISINSISKSMGKEAIDLIIDELGSNNLSIYDVINSNLHILLDNNDLSQETKHGVERIVNSIFQNYTAIDWGKIRDSSLLNLILYQVVLKSKDCVSVLESKVLDINPIFARASLNNVSYKQVENLYVKDIFNWSILAMDSSKKAVEIIARYPQFIKSFLICTNTNPAVMTIIQNHRELFNDCLCSNPNAIDLLYMRQNSINWYHFSKNVGIFELDRDKMANSLRKSSRQSGLLDAINIAADTRKYRPRYIENFVDEIESLNNHTSIKSKSFGDKQHLLNRQTFAKKNTRDLLTNSSPSIKSLPTYKNDVNKKEKSRLYESI
jgi:hypothetical protein